MRKILANILLGAAVVTLLACGNGCKRTTKEVIHNPVTVEGGEIKSEDPDGPKIKFDNPQHDFGTVMQGERLTHDFTFTNTGKKDLVISSVTASCGCTTSVPPREPIRPGEKGTIKVTFDSKTKKGEVANAVWVAANTYPTRTVLTVKAFVKEP